jgi:hypothetical protein
MRIIHSLVIVAVCTLTASCVETSSKFKSLLAERDSLQTQAQTIEDNYNETLDILNEVENGFQSIRESEGKMIVDLKSIEGQDATKKNQVIAEINHIKEILAQNRERISQLERKLNQSSKQNKILASTIERIQNELNEKSALITTLQEQLNQKEIKISELNNTINTITTDLENLRDTSNTQQQIINAQDENLNSVWYCIATRRELKEAGILSSGSIFKDKKGEADMSIFVKADLRKLHTIFLNSRSVKLLSTHPEGSYSFEKSDDKLLTLIINNPEKFWSVSRYLVIKK